MKHIKYFESNIYNKLTYSLAGKAWNELWKNYKYKFPNKHPNIIITCDYDKNEDIGYFEILKYDDINKLFVKVGNKFLRGIPEDRIKFIQWLEELYLVK
jgi:hypothetical protein